MKLECHNKLIPLCSGKDSDSTVTVNLRGMNKLLHIVKYLSIPSIPSIILVPTGTQTLKGRFMSGCFHLKYSIPDIARKYAVTLASITLFKIVKMSTVKMKLMLRMH